ncbi:MAG TPA: DUF4118 domain-containing protein [Chthoniobacterales bacterium]
MKREPSPSPARGLRQNEFITAIAGVGALTAICWFLASLIGHEAIALVYLLGVLLAGMVLERWPVLIAAALSALSWNFLFIPPHFTFRIAKLEDGLMFATYFIVALAVGSLTTRLRAREQLASQVRVAEESERLRKALLDCVSHELKTPVAAIGAASEALALSTSGANDGALTRQLATEIKDGSHRLNRVVNNLLDMTRLESGVVEPKREWCDVRDLLESAIDSEREALSSHPVNVRTPDDLPLVSLDHALVEQAVAKLIGNAAAYSPTGAPIEIAARTDADKLHITVSDRGPGIRPGDEALLFEKFYRGDAAKAGGLGLGLSIARGFIEAHGGKLTAGNLADGGACFTITLPARMTDARAVEPIT